MNSKILAYGFAFLCLIVASVSRADSYHRSVWEEVEKPFIGNMYYNVLRAPTPDGWLVVVNRPGCGVATTYVPDAAHIWSGQ